MVDENNIQQQAKKIDELVHSLETIGDPAARAASKNLVQLLMDLHGSGLERILEIVFQSGDSGAPMIDEFGRDPLVSSLLVLYGIHPEELQTRVERKLGQIGSKLHKMGAEAQLISVNGGEVRLRVSVDGHACGSTTGTVKAMVEEAMYEAAPDLTSLSVEGLEAPVASGFVGVEQLLGSSPSPPSQLHQAVEASSEGMD